MCETCCGAGAAVVSSPAQCHAPTGREEQLFAIHALPPGAAAAESQLLGRAQLASPSFAASQPRSYAIAPAAEYDCV